MNEFEPLYMTLRSADGENDETVEVTGPRVVRFAVGSHTRRSSVWRVWSNNKSSDVYVAVRNIAGVQKFSLHESGQWHMAYNTPEAAEQWGGKADRFMDTWSRPDHGITGWTKALAVKVPHGSLSDLPDEPADDAVLWLPEAPEGKAAVVGIAVVAANQGWVEMRGRPVAAYRLVNGEAVVLVYEIEDMTDAIRTSLADAMTEIPIAPDQVASISDWMSEAVAPRTGIFGHDADDVRVVWDVRIDKIAINRRPQEPPDPSR